MHNIYNKYTHTPLHFDLLINTYIACLVYCKYGALNIGLHVSFWIIFFPRYMPRNEIAGSYSDSIFSCLRNLHTIFYSDCTNLYSHQQYRKLSFSLHLLQYLLYVGFLIMAICVKWYLTVVLTCSTSLIS